MLSLKSPVHTKKAYWIDGATEQGNLATALEFNYGAPKSQGKDTKSSGIVENFFTLGKQRK